MINPIVKRILLYPYKRLTKIEIGKSTNKDLTYVFSPRYDIKTLYWQDPTNEKIEANGVIFDIDEGSTPNCIVVSNNFDLVFDIEDTTTTIPVGNATAFDRFYRLFSTNPLTENRIAVYGTKISNVLYHFTLNRGTALQSELGLINNLDVESLIVPDFGVGSLEDLVNIAFSNKILNGIPFIVKFEYVGSGEEFALVIPDDDIKAYKTSDEKTYEVVYDVADFQTKPMVFDGDSQIIINKFEIEIEEV